MGVFVEEGVPGTRVMHLIYEYLITCNVYNVSLHRHRHQQSAISNQVTRAQAQGHVAATFDIARTLGYW